MRPGRGSCPTKRSGARTAPPVAGRRWDFACIRRDLDHARRRGSRVRPRLGAGVGHAVARDEHRLSVLAPHHWPACRGPARVSLRRPGVRPAPATSHARAATPTCGRSASTPTNSGRASGPRSSRGWRRVPMRPGRRSTSRRRVRERWSSIGERASRSWQRSPCSTAVFTSGG